MNTSVMLPMCPTNFVSYPCIIGPLNVLLQGNTNRGTDWFASNVLQITNEYSEKNPFTAVNANIHGDYLLWQQWLWDVCPFLQTRKTPRSLLIDNKHLFLEYIYDALQNNEYIHCYYYNESLDDLSSDATHTLLIYGYDPQTHIISYADSKYLQYQHLKMSDDEFIIRQQRITKTSKELFDHHIISFKYVDKSPQSPQDDRCLFSDKAIYIRLLQYLNQNYNPIWMSQNSQFTHGIAVFGDYKKYLKQRLSDCDPIYLAPFSAMCDHYEVMKMACVRLNTKGASKYVDEYEKLHVLMKKVLLILAKDLITNGIHRKDHFSKVNLYLNQLEETDYLLSCNLCKMLE